MSKTAVVDVYSGELGNLKAQERETQRSQLDHDAGFDFTRPFFSCPNAVLP